MLGSTTFSPDVISVVGFGTGIGARSDSFYFLHQSLQGDGQVVVRLDKWLEPTAGALAGVMMRDDLSDSSRDVFLGLSPQGRVLFQRRKTPNAKSWQLTNPGSIPKWLHLVRQGDTISGWTSQNGDTWAFVWAARVHISDTIIAGLAVTAGQADAAAGVQFDHTQVGSLPSGSLDIGLAGLPLSLRLAGITPGAHLIPDTGAQLLVTGSPGALTALEASNDLKTWTELTRFTLSSMPQDFEEDLQPLRFYRARPVSP
ncbi:MAG: hypothetical protein JWM16_5897 [Verrucomicrobiales bacterium]|nr:hypothetical protein [Verrucomicrobiales bacterium]